MPDHGQEDLRSNDDAVASRRSLAIWIWSALFIADSVLVTRRLSGEFATPLPAGIALFSTALVAMASLVAWQVFSRASVGHPESQRQRLQSRGCSLAATVLWAWAISRDATPLAAGLLVAIVALVLWGLVAVEPRTAASSGDPRAVDKPDGAKVGEDSVLIEARNVPTPSLPVLDESTDDELAETGNGIDEEAADELDGSLTLWLARRQTDEGEQIEGWVRVPFAAGQRETTVHVAFCPPMSACPEIETEELDGAGLEIRVAAVFPFGVRLSVRRSGKLDDRNSDRIGFIAQALPAQRAA